MNKIISIIDAKSGAYELLSLNFFGKDDASLESAETFGGQIEQLNLDDWLSLFAQYSKEGDANTQSLPAKEVVLNIESLIFMSREFKDIELKVKREIGGYQIIVDSERIRGVVDLADDIRQKGVVAQFDYLNWKDADIAKELTVQEVASGIPDIHLWVDQFSYAGIPLGEFRMEMRNVADGLKVEQLTMKSDLVEINVSGQWLKSEQDIGRSDFNVVMISENIADFLKAVGFNAPITNAQTLIKLDASWDGVPSQFDMKLIDGSLDIKIGQGEVLDQQPGFGRVLGLFNLTNLPRRLLLDFRDVLAEGLHFSGMEGHFEISNGIASTEDFLISASSAKIFIKGDVGFTDQNYSQTITIRPQIGKTFPTIGAIAGGPVGAAAGFLVQGLFDKQLGMKNEIVYEVTGSWDDPVIELISNE